MAVDDNPCLNVVASARYMSIPAFNKEVILPSPSHGSLFQLLICLLKDYSYSCPSPPAQTPLMENNIKWS